MAKQLLDDTIRAQRGICVPPHFMGEVCNGIYQKLRSTDPANHISEDEAALALADALRWPVEVVAPSGLYQAAFDFARAPQLTSLYDSLYVVLAQMLGGELWTADRRLLAALGTGAPWVRSLADYGTA